MTTAALEDVLYLSGAAGQAVLSKDEVYRYFLTRELLKGGPTLGVCGHNPATADHNQNDMTVKKAMGFAARLGAGRLLVANVFGYRSTAPGVLRAVADPVGPANDRFLAALARDSDRLVVAWGEVARPLGPLFLRSLQALREARGGRPVECFGRTKSGNPSHLSRLGYAIGLASLGSY